MTPIDQRDLLRNLEKSFHTKAILRMIPSLPKAVYIVRGVKVLKITVDDVVLNRPYAYGRDTKEEVGRLTHMLFWLNPDNKPELKEITLYTTEKTRSIKKREGLFHTVTNRTLSYPEVFLTRKEATKNLKKTSSYISNAKEWARFYIVIICYIQYVSMLLVGFTHSVYALILTPVLIPLLIRNIIIRLKK